MDRRRENKGQRDELPHIEHWETVYRNQPVETTSWFQVTPEVSLALIGQSRLEKNAAIIDVGGGASKLVDNLLLQGFEDVSVLDISASALRISKARLNNPLRGVHWIECDLLHFEPERRYDLWHDRALFHFMTGERQRAAYRRILDKAVAPGGHVIIATFAIDGPEQCSGLPVRRYDADAVREEFGDGYRLESEQPESHLTPGGTVQKFTYFRLRRL
jgi:SAM-dependent methyltransferase